MRDSPSLRLIGIAMLGLSTWAFAGAPSEGYSQSIRASQYVAVRDGTRLAIDIYRPVVEGKPVEKPLPVILEATIDYRVDVRDGKLVPPATYLMDLLKHGYVIALLETRGQGASFGRQSPMRIETVEDYRDLYDVVEWLAAQPWSDGKIGMVGCSNRGVIQLRAAAAMPPHLKAIAPTAAPVDWGTMGTINGVTTRCFGEGHKPVQEPTPVDEDRDGTMAQRAVMEHGAWGKAQINRPFRDAPLTLSGLHVMPTYWWNMLPNFTVSKIPVFQYAGWRDFFPEQAFDLYRSLARQGVPQKLIIGPWYHCEWYQSDLTDAAAETRRWYDYWLKGINNGLMDEPPIRYYVAGAPAGQEWKTADKWPPPNERRTTYYLGDQGRLQLQKPNRPADNDSYVVNYSVTTANLATRWNIAIFTDPKNAAKHPGLLPIPTSGLDANSLTYTSAPLEQDSELTGFPVATLWISSTAKDQDFFVYLEEVGADGQSTLLTEGAMRASNRATREPPFDNEGMPWHAGFKADQKDLQPGVPTKLDWGLFPFSNYLKKAHRLRITINSFDKEGWLSPEIAPAPTVSIYHDAQHPSSITLPFISK